MKITIEDKAFELKFGFKCLKILGESLDCKTFKETLDKFSEFEKAEASDVSFDQINLIESLIAAAAEAHPNYYQIDYSIQDVSIIDEIMKQPEMVSEVMQHFVDSVSATVGKPKASTKARQNKKK